MTVPCTARVLVVENDLKSRGQLMEVLTRPGFIVKAAEGQGPALQENAKDLAGQFKPHVVVMDLRLLDDEYSADKSGLELLKDKSFSYSRCVLHSAYLNHDYKVTREALLEARVADVVGKEESPRRLISAVEKAAREDCICNRDFSIEWPLNWDEKFVITTLFEDDADLPSDVVRDIFGHLFPDDKTIKLMALKGAAKSSVSVFRGRAALFQAWVDNKEPVVVKLAPRKRVEKEVNAYKTYIQDLLLGRFYAQLQDHKIFWELGGSCYSFIGSSQKAIETFAVFYQRAKTSREIIKPLRHFFGEVWRRRYNDTCEHLSGNLFTAYDSCLKLSKHLDKYHFHEEKQDFTDLYKEFLDPFHWIIEHKGESLIHTAKLAVTHGDLHGDNLFIEEDHAWAIDFERSGPGPILRDFVELEQDIVTRLIALPTSDLQSYLDLIHILSAPNKPSESLKMPVGDQSEEIIKALEVIEAIRSMAYEITRYQDIREYYWGLLLDTIFAVISTEKQSTSWSRGLLFASVLCNRLDQWSIK